jgi:hypothetical protein
MRIGIATTLAFSVAVFSGCQQHGKSQPGTPAVASADTSPNAAIQTAIQAHLAHNGNLRLDSFDMEVKQVTFDGDHARAQVEFHAKSGGGTMQLTYALVKRDGAWSVVESTPRGSNFSHPGLDRRKEPRLAEKREATQMFSRYWTNCMMEQLPQRRISRRGIRRLLPRLRTNNHKSDCSPDLMPVHYDRGPRVHQ